MRKIADDVSSEISEEFRERVCGIYLYGSLIKRKKSTEDVDVDLLVVFEVDDALSTILELKTFKPNKKITYFSYLFKPKPRQRIYDRVRNIINKYQEGLDRMKISITREPISILGERFEKEYHNLPVKKGVVDLTLSHANALGLHLYSFWWQKPEPKTLYEKRKLNWRPWWWTGSHY